MNAALDEVGRLTCSKRYRLRDGTPVEVRPIRPSDRQRLLEGFQRLSAESRYQRFLGAVRVLSERQLRSLTEIDHKNHEAWVAFDPDSPGQPGLGVARYIRLDGEPGVAEVAVTVLDSHQGRGLGTLLLGLLCRSAAQQGIETFRAWVFETNTSMVRIFRDLGATVRREDGAVLLLDMQVPRDPGRLPDTPTCRVFKAIAAGMPDFDTGEPPGGA